MISASPHPDSLILFNEAMCNAFNDYMHKQENPLFAFNGQNWKTWRDISELENIVVEYAKKFPHNTRRNLWVHILTDHFMRFTESEYKKAVDSCFKKGTIVCDTPIQKGGTRPTSRLNDNCIINAK
jgi:hypothetical protein